MLRKRNEREVEDGGGDDVFCCGFGCSVDFCYSQIFEV